MKRTKIAIAVFLAVILLVAVSIAAFAAGDAPSSAKEEVVYANMDGAGNVNDVYVVNIFNGGNITDYGRYASVKILNTTDKINQKGDGITISSNADKVYYEGALKNAALPWNIDISYTLDGKKVTADELAGQSGKLEMKISIRQNTACDSTFFDHYALQTEVTLDTGECGNIVADGATIADVGRDKQISYILMPGNEKDYTIVTDVTDFKMDAIAFNGLRMGMSIDIDDNALLDKVSEIEDAASDLNGGASSLASGATSIASGTFDLSGATGTIASGATDLTTGMESLQIGLKTAQSGLDALNKQSSTLTGSSTKVKTTLHQIDTALSAVSLSADKVAKLVSASSSIQQSLTSLDDSLNSLQSQISYSAYKSLMSQSGLNVDALQSSNSTSVSALNSDISALEAMISDLQSKESLLDAAGYGNLYDTYMATLKQTLSDMKTAGAIIGGDTSAINGINSYLSGLHNSASSLSTAASTLDSSYDTFNTEIEELASNLTSMIASLSQLSAAVQTLTNQYDTFDQGVNDYTDGVAALVAGFNQVLAGTTQLVGGSQNLAEGVSLLYSGTEKLSSSNDALSDGAGKLASGTDTFYSGIANMDTTVANEIDDMISSLTGSNAKTISFVSDKNTKVNSVQFVIKTTMISTDDETTATEDETDTTTKTDSGFFTKLIDLLK